MGPRIGPRENGGLAIDAGRNTLLPRHNTKRTTKSALGMSTRNGAILTWNRVRDVQEDDTAGQDGAEGSVAS